MPPVVAVAVLDSSPAVVHSDYDRHTAGDAVASDNDAAAVAGIDSSIIGQLLQREVNSHL